MWSAIGDLVDILRNVSRETWRLYNEAYSAAGKIHLH